ncbi:MAG: hypothetical protein JWP58_1082 [Hymenobacter sp.]|nr:hypothetical protein [Hymenobacter sp.]
MRDPIVSPVELIPSVENWLAQVNQIFADNKFGLTTEADFRTAFAGAATVFADWRHLSVKRVKGATYPVPYLDNLGLVPADYRILGMQVEAVNGVDSATGGTGVVAPPVFFTLQRNSAGDVDALLNPDPDTILTVKASYVRTSGTDEQKIASYVELPLEDTPLDAGDVYKYTFPGGETRLVEVRNDLRQPQNPVPTGLESDVYYKPYAPLTSAHEHAQNTDAGTTAGEFRLRFNSSFQDHGLGATVLIFEGSQGGNQGALRFRFQNADDTDAAVFEQCLAYTGTATDTWTTIGGTVPPDTVAYAGNVALDLAANPMQTLVLAGNAAFTTANRRSGGQKVLRIICDGIDRTLSFPSAWDWLGTAAPTSLAAGKKGILSLTSFGTAETDVIAAYAPTA